MIEEKHQHVWSLINVISQNCIEHTLSRVGLALTTYVIIHNDYIINIQLQTDRDNDDHDLISYYFIYYFIDNSTNTLQSSYIPNKIIYELL